MTSSSGRGIAALMASAVAVCLLGTTTAAPAAAAPEQDRLSLSLDGQNWTTSPLELWPSATIVPGDHFSTEVWIRNNSADDAAMDVEVSQMTLATDEGRPFYQDVVFTFDWTDLGDRQASGAEALADVEIGDGLSTVLPPGGVTSVTATVDYPKESTEGGDSNADAFTVALSVGLSQSLPEDSDPGAAPGPGGFPDTDGPPDPAANPGSGDEPEEDSMPGLSDQVLPAPEAAPGQTQDNDNPLAVTGVNIALFILLSFALIAGGALALRTRRAHQPD